MKQYNGEKAIISLTTWKARINTVGLTIFSLVKRCPGFHIVLVLSEEEFPKKEAELPDSIMAFVNQDLIELLWVYKNYKSFKKVLFTMAKYKDVPVISADDDCIYKYNYAEELYKYSLKHKNAIISETTSSQLGILGAWGYATLHPPIYNIDHLLNVVEYVTRFNNYHDDILYATYAKLNHIPIIGLSKTMRKVVIPIPSCNKSSSYKVRNTQKLNVVNNYKEAFKAVAKNLTEALR